MLLTPRASREEELFDVAEYPGADAFFSIG